MQQVVHRCRCQCSDDLLTTGCCLQPTVVTHAYQYTNCTSVMFTNIPKTTKLTSAFWYPSLLMITQSFQTLNVSYKNENAKQLTKRSKCHTDTNIIQTISMYCTPLLTWWCNVIFLNSFLGNAQQLITTLAISYFIAA